MNREERMQFLSNIVADINKAVAEFNLKHNASYPLFTEPDNMNKDVMSQFSMLGTDKRNRIQIFVLSTKVVMFYGVNVKAVFDSVGFTLFNSNYVNDRIDKTYAYNSDKLGFAQFRIEFKTLDEFYPMFVNAFIAMFKGENIDIDTQLKKIYESIAEQTNDNAQESVKTQEKPKTQARRKKSTDKATGDEKTQTVEKKPRQKNKA